MPLHRDHEMIGRSSFQRLDNAIVGTARHDAQPLAGDIGRLVVRRVDGHNEWTPGVRL